jgi:hypothetical protein
MFIDVNERSMLDSCLFKSQGLTSGTSTEFDSRQSAFLGLRPTSLCPRFCEPRIFGPSSRLLWEKTSRGRETPFHLPSSCDGPDYLTSGASALLEKIYLQDGPTHRYFSAISAAECKIRTGRITGPFWESGTQS